MAILRSWAFGSGGLGVDGDQFGLPSEPVFFQQVDFRGDRSERLQLDFAEPASDIEIVLGRFFADEAGLGELAQFTAFDALGNTIATGALDPNVNGTLRDADVWAFDLGLEDVARLDLTAADITRDGSESNLQSDFNLQKLTFTPRR